MKKLALTAFVVLTFIIYSFHQRSEGTQAISQLSPATGGSLSKTSTPAGSTPPDPSGATHSSQYKDGTYTGSSSDAFYGYIQVSATISGGRLSDVTFLDYPHDRGTSIEINSYAMPLLKQQAIQAQSAQVDGVSGATDSSMAFIQSLGDALNQAKS